MRCKQTLWRDAPKEMSFLYNCTERRRRGRRLCHLPTTSTYVRYDASKISKFTVPTLNEYLQIKL